MSTDRHNPTAEDISAVIDKFTEWCKENDITIYIHSSASPGTPPNIIFMIDMDYYQQAVQYLGGESSGLLEIITGKGPLLHKFSCEEFTATLYGDKDITKIARMLKLIRTRYNEKIVLSSIGFNDRDALKKFSDIGSGLYFFNNQENVDRLVSMGEFSIDDIISVLNERHYQEDYSRVHAHIAYHQAWLLVHYSEEYNKVATMVDNSYYDTLKKRLVYKG